jgi:predicted TIM-barrel enzyme
MSWSRTDVVVAHVHTTVAGSIGVKTAASLDEAVARVQAIHDAAKSVNPEVIVLCHGGPIAHPEDAQYVLRHTTGVAGFFGASSIERLPTEPAIEGQARAFKSLEM